jgi:hypothetical protein
MHATSTQPLPSAALARVDTTRIKPRQLELHSPAAALAEARRLAALSRVGRLQAMGNWSPGTVFAHLAWWVEAIDNGKMPKAPWFVRMLGPLMKRKLLAGTPAPGMRMHGAPSGTFGDEPCDLEEGLARLERAMNRLERQRFPERHPVFGPMSPREWVALHLRHAELHMGFLQEE